jgi:hypothetical protein
MSVPLVSLDFRVDPIPPYLFNNGLGLCNGTIFGCPDGAVISSLRYTSTANTKTYDSWIDSFKFFTFLSTPVVVSNNRETRFEADIAMRQVFSEEKPIPECLYKRVRNIYEDLRLASSGLAIIDPDTGVWYGILGTDHQLWGVYGRLPIYRLTWPGCIRSIFQVLNVGCALSTSVLPRCVPWYDCKKSDSECERALTHCLKRNRFDKNNFADDTNFATWKKCMTARRLTNWKKFLDWKEEAKKAKTQIYDWLAYTDFDKAYKAPKIDANQIEAVKNTKDYDEYCLWLLYNCWKSLKKQYLFTERDPCQKDLPSCVTESADMTLSDAPCVPKIFYEYGGMVDPIPEYAAFLSAVPLVRRESANPQSDFDRVALVFDAQNNHVHYLVNNKNIYTVVKPGHRTDEQYRLTDYGGYAENIVSSRFLVGFGNFTFLDAALPNNYARQKMECDYREKTGLAQLLPDGAYYQIAFNKHGELEPVVSSEGFGITNDKPEDHLFGQGAVLVVRNLLICQDTVKNDNALFKPITLLGVDEVRSTDVTPDDFVSTTDEWKKPSLVNGH